MSKIFINLLAFIEKAEDTKIIETKNGYFFYRGLIKENRGRFRIKNKVEYKTGYQYETFICQEDISNFDEFAEDQITDILFNLGFDGKIIDEVKSTLL